MKRIIFFIALAACPLFSCSEQDGDRYFVDTNKLQTTWTLQKSVLNGVEINAQDYMEFTPESTVEFTYLGAASNGEDSIERGDYSILEKTLIINWNDDLPGSRISKYKILEISNTKLRWEIVVPNQGKHIETFTRQ